DIRHNFLMDVVYAEPYRFSNKAMNLVGGGWTVSGKAYWRSGQPFSVLNKDASSALGSNGTGRTTVLAAVLNNHFDHHCNSYANPCFQEPGIFNGAGPQDAGPGVVVQTNFGNVPRNAFYGPHFADVDVALLKTLYKRESLAFQVGAQAYNALNHVN